MALRTAGLAVLAAIETLLTAAARVTAQTVMLPEEQHPAVTLI